MALAEYIEACKTIEPKCCKVCNRQVRFRSRDGACSACHFITCDFENCQRCKMIAVGVMTFLAEDDPKERRRERDRKNRQWK
jgi:hypothetical protein